MSLENYFTEPELVLSEEAQTQAVADTQDLQHEVHFFIEDSERLEGVQEGLEGLKGIIASIESATAKDIALVRSAGDLALAGTGADHTSLFPSLESAEGATISVEGIGEIISDIWRAIVRAVKRVWEAIMGFFGKIKDQAGRLKKQNTAMRERMSKVAGKKPKSKQTNLEREAEQIAIAGRVPKNGKEIVDNLRVMSQQAGVVYKDYANQLVSTGDKLIAALNKFDITKPSESLERVVEASNTLSLDAVKAMMAKMGNGTIKDSRWANMQVIGGAHLLGGKNIFQITSSAKAEKGNVLELSEKARKRELTLANTEAKAGRKITNATIATIESEQGIEIAQLNEQIIEVIAEFDKRKDKIDKVRRQLEQAGYDLEKNSKKANETVPDNSAMYVAEALKYVTAYGHWTAKPMVDMGSHFYSVVRATITVCNKSVANYE